MVSTGKIRQGLQTLKDEAFVRACWRGNFSKARRYLFFGADVNVVGVHGTVYNTLLRQAVHYDRINVIKFLVSLEQLDLNMVDARDGYTAAHEAALLEYHPYGDFFFTGRNSKNADYLDMREMERQIKGRIEIASILREAGIDLTLRTSNNGRSGSTAFEILAIFSRNLEAWVKNGERPPYLHGDYQPVKELLDQFSCVLRPVSSYVLGSWSE